MNERRQLRLRKEVLSELTDGELRDVVAGDAVTKSILPVNTCFFCVTQPSGCVCVSNGPTQCC